MNEKESGPSEAAAACPVGRCALRQSLSRSIKGMEEPWGE